MAAEDLAVPRTIQTRCGPKRPQTPGRRRPKACGSQRFCDGNRGTRFCTLARCTSSCLPTAGSSVPSDPCRRNRARDLDALCCAGFPKRLTSKPRHPDERRRRANPVVRGAAPTHLSGKRTPEAGPSIVQCDVLNQKPGQFNLSRFFTTSKPREIPCPGLAESGA